LEQFPHGDAGDEHRLAVHQLTAEVKLGAFEAMESDALLSRCDRFTPEIAAGSWR
jgi:hypothetical protein